MLLDRRLTLLSRFSCVPVAGIMMLCLLTGAAYAQTASDTPAQSDPAGAQVDQSPPQADGQSASPSSNETQTAENSEADCGCPKVDPGAAQAVNEASSVIAANVGEPDKICGLITPIVSANPCAAPDVIAAAGAHPEIAEKLAQCLSKIQSGLKSKTPEAAATVEKVVSCASPAFQAAYSESLAPDDADSPIPGADGPGGTDGPAAATTGTATSTSTTGGDGGFGPTSTFGSFSRFGAGQTRSSGAESFGGGSVSPF